MSPNHTETTAVSDEFDTKPPVPSDPETIRQAFNVAEAVIEIASLPYDGTEARLTEIRRPASSESMRQHRSELPA